MNVTRRSNRRDTSVLPNRIAAGPMDLKVVGRREHENVRRNDCKNDIKKRLKDDENFKSDYCFVYFNFTFY